MVRSLIAAKTIETKELGKHKLTPPGRAHDDIGNDTECQRSILLDPRFKSGPLRD